MATVVPDNFEEPEIAAPVASSSPALGPGLSKLRTTDFKLTKHSHGKSKVRVLKVRKSENGVHEISEWIVHTVLYSPTYERVFTKEDNSELVATDTQKNTVYVVAKRSTAATCEEFALDVAEHFLVTYSILSGVDVEVQEIPWRRSATDGVPHAHGFEHPGHERHIALAKMIRDDAGTPTIASVESSIREMTILKTTQSGFEKFLRDDFTLLPECTDRCLSTHMDIWWRYVSPQDGKSIDFKATRATMRNEMLRGVFGPADKGVYSVSLQASIYDSGCLALTALPAVQEIDISTPNVHYLPVVGPLEALGEKFENDIFQPTSDPSGSITCTVSR